MLTPSLNSTTLLRLCLCLLVALFFFILREFFPAFSAPEHVRSHSNHGIRAGFNVRACRVHPTGHAVHSLGRHHIKIRMLSRTRATAQPTNRLVLVLGTIHTSRRCCNWHTLILPGTATACNFWHRRISIFTRRKSTSFGIDCVGQAIVCPCRDCDFATVRHFSLGAGVLSNLESKMQLHKEVVVVVVVKTQTTRCKALIGIHVEKHREVACVAAATFVCLSTSLPG